MMPHRASEYMHWAKTQQRARFTLATSGVGAYPIEDLHFDASRLAINGNNSYGYAPLLDAIARHQGVSTEHVVTAQGTSFANYLAMAAILNPGDEVLIERPAYGLLVDAALQIGARVRRFDRPLTADAVTPQTKLIVVTNLHNPTSELTDVAECYQIARANHAFLLVDEVYLDAIWDNRPPSAIHLGPGVIVTSSLTKIYGVSGLRCGWILAEPSLAHAMWRLNDVFGATPVHPGEIMSVAAFEKLPMLKARARQLVETDRQALHAFLDATPQVRAPRQPYGTTSFIELLDRPVEPFLRLLREKYETSAVPGHFFDRPTYFRIGMGVDNQMFAEGLARITLALQTR